MQKLSLRKKLGIIRLYLDGHSYHEIVTRSSIGKGSITNIVAELKAGQILDIQGPTEQLELLRELSIDLRRHNLTPGQALVGLSALTRLQELGVEPSEIESWTAMCREMATDEHESPVIVHAAMSLREIQKRTGLDVEALEKKVLTMEQEAARLEPIAKELKRCPKELEELKKHRQALTKEIEQLEKRYKPLRQSITEYEGREKDLFRRVKELEEKAHRANEQLAASRRDLQSLAELGLSRDELPGFVHRLSGLAQKHGIKPKDLRERLLHELEALEASIRLDSSINDRLEELDKIEQSIETAKQEHESVNTSLKKLRQQQEDLRQKISIEEDCIREELQDIVEICTEAATKLKQDLGRSIVQTLMEVQKLRDESVELGRQLGQCEELIEANEWLRNLLVLVKNDGTTSASYVRMISLLVLRGVNSWIAQNQADTQLPYHLTPYLRASIEEFEKWKV